MINKLNKNILVVDNSMTNLVLLEAVLNLHGFAVRTAYSHDFAKRIMERWKPDLIILDLLMPDQEKGYGFFNYLKNHTQFRNSKVAIVSALSNKNIIKQTLADGAIGYITKPVDLENFAENIKKILS